MSKKNTLPLVILGLIASSMVSSKTFGSDRHPGTYELTGFLLIDSQRTAFTINPAMNDYLRITVLNRDEVKKSVAKESYAKLVDARINILKFTGPFTAEGWILKFRLSNEGAAPTYNRALRRVKSTRSAQSSFRF